LIVAFNFNTAGIDHAEIMVQPFSRTIQTIAGYPRFIFYNRQPIPDDPVKDRGFTHVRAADNRYNGPRHANSFPSSIHHMPS
jgi:hypothetical protein